MNSTDLSKELSLFEQGELSEIEEIKLFSELIKTKMVFNLTTIYSEYASNFIKSKILDSQGNILINLGDIYG